MAVIILTNKEGLMKKYSLTNETIQIDTITLHRIKALINIPEAGIKAGELGGFVETEYNLSHYDSC